MAGAIALATSGAEDTCRKQVSSVPAIVDAALTGDRCLA
jgi:hypothetical protein